MERTPKGTQRLSDNDLAKRFAGEMGWGPLLPDGYCEQDRYMMLN